MELDDAFLVGVCDGKDLTVHPSLRVQFLANLTPQAVFMRFARFALAAGKLPVPRQVRILWPPCHEVVVVALDDSSRHDDGGTGRGSGHQALRSFSGLKG